jgi:hypothetical protein
VYRVDEVESGRITPTIPVALATGLGGVVGGALAVDAGGLVSLQTALTVCGELLDDADELLPGLQAASVRTATVPIAAIGKVDLRRFRARLTRGPAFLVVVQQCALDTGNA